MFKLTVCIYPFIYEKYSIVLKERFVNVTISRYYKRSINFKKSYALFYGYYTKYLYKLCINYTYVLLNNRHYKLNTTLAKILEKIKKILYVI